MEVNPVVNYSSDSGQLELELLVDKLIVDGTACT